MCWERKEKKKERKKIEKRNRGKSEGDGGFKRFSSCRGNSFLFVLLKGNALISESGTWMVATLVTSFLPWHLQRMHGYLFDPAFCYFIFSFFLRFVAIICLDKKMRAFAY